MKFDLEVDAIGLKCPLPILYCKRGLNSIRENQILKIKTTDKSALKGFKSFCDKTGHQLIEYCKENEITTFYIKRLTL
jgi:tRNA 2-thiouridine synthesizing protein A